MDDLIKAVLRLLAGGAQGVQYVVPPDAVSVKHAATLIRDIVKPGITLRFDTTKPEGRRTIPTLPSHKSLRAMKWTPLKTGLQKTYRGWKNKHKEATLAA